VGRLSLQHIDAVTVDAYGTLLRLRDPLPLLGSLLPGHVTGAIERAFQAEAAYYLAHSHEGRDPESLQKLRAECTGVFNRALGSDLSPEQYIGTLRFELVPGVVDALRRLRALGLALAVVANWDYGLHEQLAEHALVRWFDAVVCSADTGLRKPDPAPFRLALERLGVEAHRAVHVGDHPPDDEVGALAAGLRFAPAPLEGLLAA
jgi:HAD superfamily hydrolase (TIGR01549 family)